MNLVKDWLLEFVSLPPSVTDEEIARRLSAATVEVEGIKKESPDAWDHIVVGTIHAMTPHPNADRLRVTRVLCGTGDTKTIVCGGSNLLVGMKVAVALPGAHVRWHGQGEPVVLEETQIRGVKSDGMICASSEIGLGEIFPAHEEREILDLSGHDVPDGTSLAIALSLPTVFEIDNKSLSHRPDLWGYRGIARELSALFGAPFHDKKLPALPQGSGHAFSVRIHERDLCSRYMGLVVDGVSQALSPPWLAQRLRASGIRPVSALVDITNYVMLEYGQPMHVFDYDAIAGKKGAQIVVRRARDQETIRTLDGNDYALSPDMLIIANETRPLAIAGVMGGEESGVSDKTKTVIFEAANFAPFSIRRTALALGLTSESSRRFEKDLDPELPALAMARCLQLCALIFPKSRVTSTVHDSYRTHPRQRSILLTSADIERVLGTAVPLSRAATLLKRLGFGVQAEKQSLKVIVPSFRRKDITILEDVLEEIIRLMGYEALPSSLPRVSLTQPRIDAVKTTVDEFKQYLTLNAAFREVLAYAFVRPQTIRACGLTLDDHLELANPLSQERPFLCRSLIPNLLEMIEKNQQQEKRQALFEVNRVFLKEGVYPGIPSDTTPSVPSQPLHCAFVYTSREGNHPFITCADMVRRFLRTQGWSGVLTSPSSLSLFSRTCSAVIMVNNEVIGHIGALAPSVRRALGINQETIASELNLSALVMIPRTGVSYHSEPVYPPVLRDVTFVLDEKHPYDMVKKTIENAHSLIEHIEPFALYRDKKLGAGKKSLSFHIYYRSPDRTLVSKEVERAHARVIEELKKKIHALPR